MSSHAIIMAATGIQVRAGVITDRLGFWMAKRLTLTAFRAFACCVVPLVLVCLAASVGSTEAQSQPNTTYGLQRKLNQRVEFKPKAEAPLEQLIEVAKTYEIPMGIEWSEPTKCEGRLNSPMKTTVRELLTGIIKRCPDRSFSVANGILHIRSSGSFNQMNILNLRISRFHVKNASLFTAEHELRIAIDQQLHPQEYANGYNGGYGYGPGDVFALPNVTFSATNVSVRSVLDRIAASNGNALWVARFSQTHLKSGTLAQVYNWEAIAGVWHFVPLKA